MEICLGLCFLSSSGFASVRSCCFYLFSVKDIVNAIIGNAEAFPILCVSDFCE